MVDLRHLKPAGMPVEALNQVEVEMSTETPTKSPAKPKVNPRGLAVFEPFTGEALSESDSSEEALERVTLEGGGGHGGKRENTGKKCGKSNKDWKIYKKLGKKDSEKIKKTNTKIDNFFKKLSSTSSHPAENEDNNNSMDGIDDKRSEDAVSNED